MSVNRIRKPIHDRRKALGISLTDPSAEMVELAGRVGLDFVHFDGHHAPLTPERMGLLCQIADGFGITPTMRVPNQRESTILSYLDKGVRVIIVPNLQTREEAEALIRHAYYAPIGRRSATSIRTVFHQDDGDRFGLFCRMNMATMVVPQLESVSALENLDEILSVDCIDYFTSGFEDLAQPMGHPGEHTHPKVLEAWDDAVTRIHAAGKHIYDDYIDSIDVFGSVHQSMLELLQRNSRSSKLQW